jgi:hypothetical protein
MGVEKVVEVFCFLGAEIDKSWLFLKLAGFLLIKVGYRKAVHGG